MAVQKDLVPLSVVKHWSKRLTKAWPEVSDQPSPQLSTTQEAVARMLGHSNWQHLLRHYEVPGTASDAAGPMLNSSSWNSLSDLLASAMILQVRKVVVTVEGERAGYEGWGDQGRQAIFESSREHALEWLKTFFELITDDDGDVSFRPQGGQQSWSEIELGGQPVMVHFRAVGLAQHGLRVEMDLIPLAPGVTPGLGLPVFEQMTQGIGVLAAPHGALKRELVARCVLGMAQQHQVLMVTNSTYPQLDHHPQIMVHTFSNSGFRGEPHLGYALDATRSFGHHIVVVDYSELSDHWTALGRYRHKGIPCWIVMDGFDGQDILIQLDQQQQLQDWLRYGFLQAMVSATDYDRLTQPEVIILSEHLRDELMKTQPSGWRRTLKKSLPKSS